MKEITWINIKEVKAAARDGLEAAKAACLRHWGETRDNGPKEFLNAAKKGLTGVYAQYCALCEIFYDINNETCDNCPLTPDPDDNICCIEWYNARDRIEADIYQEPDDDWSPKAREAIDAMIKRIEDIEVK
ncbi:MAG: hypothetical protein GY845_25685 [Planctomycetes bacterium]|nr:hypothetical protein [Planctomycetota bacterium]